MRSIVFGCCLLALFLSGHAASAGNVLITPEEAALPSAPGVTLATRGITRKPNIRMTSPKASVSAPFNLQFKFQAHGGSKIKPSSFHLIYLKTPNVDLTARVRPYVTPEGVDVPEAEAPPGQHMIKATIADSENREGSAVFVLNILK